MDSSFTSQLASLRKSASEATKETKRGDDSTNITNSKKIYKFENKRRNGDNVHSRSHSSYDRRYKPYNSSMRRGGRGNYGDMRYDREDENKSNTWLQDLVEAIPKYRPSENVERREKQQRHIAILFLTITDLPFENVWRRWLESFPPNGKKSQHPMISVLCHAKYPQRVTSSWLKQRLLASPPRKHSSQSRTPHRFDHNKSQSEKLALRYHTRKPNWGSIEITQAMLDLLQEALRIGNEQEESNIYCTSDEQYFSKRFISANEPNQESLSASIRQPTPTVDRFIFASETCIPVSTLDEVEASLFGNHVLLDQHDNPIHDHDTTTVTEHDESSSKIPGSEYSTTLAKPGDSDAGKSWLNVRNTPNNGYARQLQWDAIHSAIPREKIWKADQWILLTRHHASSIFSLVDHAVQKTLQKRRHREYSALSKVSLGLWQCFRRVKASDEVYFPTLLALLGIVSSSQSSSSHQNQQGGDEIARRRITYCDWSDNAKNPKSISITRQKDFKEFRNVVRLAREEGCLFARKFRRGGDFTDQDDCTKLESRREIITADEWFDMVTSSITLAT